MTTTAIDVRPDPSRPGWKQYASRAEGDFGDFFQRDDGNAEVFCNPKTPGWCVNVWKPYRHGAHKRTGAAGRMALLKTDLESAEAAMEMADRELPTGGDR